MFFALTCTIITVGSGCVGVSGRGCGRGTRRSLVQYLGGAEISDKDVHVLIQQDVLGLEVTVDDIQSVEVFKCH